jgi:hypothetical protein
MDWFRLGVSFVTMIILVGGMILFGNIFYKLILWSPWNLIPICGIALWILYRYVKIDEKEK